MGGIGLFLVLMLVVLTVSTLVTAVVASCKVIDKDDPVEAAAARVERDLATAEDFARDPDPRWLRSTRGAWLRRQERRDAHAFE